MNHLKKRFEDPEIEITVIEINDVITASGDDENWDTGEY